MSLIKNQNLEPDENGFYRINIGKCEDLDMEKFQEGLKEAGTIKVEYGHPILHNLSSTETLKRLFQIDPRNVILSIHDIEKAEEDYILVCTNFNLFNFTFKDKPIIPNTLFSKCNVEGFSLASRGIKYPKDDKLTVITFDLVSCHA